MGTAFYNENDAYAAQWLRNLVSAGSLPPGEVDQRSIAELEPEDLRGYQSCHFFAGIGGWPYALDLAGWPVDRPVWTGSCPCQPFSSAGKQGGSADERHLWPAWFRLIRVCRPDTILGEQVAGAVGFGWLDRVCADLEALQYAVGAAVLGAHSVGAPHIRQRLFWVADRAAGGRQGIAQPHVGAPTGQQAPRWMDIDGGGAAGGLADAQHAIGRPLGEHRQDGRDGPNGRRPETHGEPRARSEVRGVGDSESEGPQGQRPLRGAPQGELHRRQPRLPGDARTSGLGNADGTGREAPDGFPIGREARSAQPADTSFWDDSVWLPCLDGKARRTQPAIHPLAHGIPNRVGRLRAYGNAIIPQTAALFIETVLSIL